MFCFVLFILYFFSPPRFKLPPSSNPFTYTRQLHYLTNTPHSVESHWKGREAGEFKPLGGGVDQDGASLCLRGRKARTQGNDFPAIVAS